MRRTHAPPRSDRVIGLPACPDHAERGTIFELLEATDRIGVSLTESFAMMPAAAVNGLYFADPASLHAARPGAPKQRSCFRSLA